MSVVLWKNKKTTTFCCNDLELSLKKRRDLIWTQSKFNDGNFQSTLRHFLFRTPECFIMWKKAYSVFYTLPTHTPRNRPYSSSNIKAARLPARPHAVEYSSVLRRRPTSAKPHIPLIFHSTSSFLSWHSRKCSGSIRLVGLSIRNLQRVWWCVTPA